MTVFEYIMADKRFDDIPLILETPNPDLWPDEIKPLKKAARQSAKQRSTESVSTPGRGFVAFRRGGERAGARRYLRAAGLRAPPGNQERLNMRSTSRR